MFEYNLATYKTVIDDGTYINQLIAVNPNVIGFVDTGENLKVQLTTALLQTEIDALDAVVPAEKPIDLVVQDTIRKAIYFGNNVIVEAATENVLLGITQFNMTGTVRKVLSQVNSALSTGSLYDAIDEIRAIPPENKDARFVTDARLLATINKIETYLGLTLSTEV